MTAGCSPTNTSRFGPSSLAKGDVRSSSFGTPGESSRLSWNTGYSISLVAAATDFANYIPSYNLSSAYVSWSRRVHICPDTLSKHHRRTIFWSTLNVNQQLIDVLGYVPHPVDSLSKNVNGFSNTKLQIVQDRFWSRASNWRTEVQKQGIKIKKIVSHHVSQPHAETQTAAPNTPVKIATPKAKRILIHSPTPRKIKKNYL